MVVLGPTVWESVLGHPKGCAPFPYDNPALFSMTIAFVGIWLFSVLDRSQTPAPRSGLRSAVHPLRDRHRRGGRLRPLM